MTRFFYIGCLLISLFAWDIRTGNCRHPELDSVRTVADSLVLQGKVEQAKKLYWTYIEKYAAQDQYNALFQTHLFLNNLLQSNRAFLEAYEALNIAFSQQIKGAPRNAEEWRYFFYLNWYQGFNLNRLGNYSASIQYYEDALRVWDQNVDVKDKIRPSLVANLLKDLGNLHWRIGALRFARVYKNRAIQIFEELGEPEGIAKAYNDLGLNYINEEHLEEARGIFEKGLQTKNISLPDRALLLRNIAFTLHKQEKHDEAIAYTEKSLTTIDLYFASQTPNKVRSIYNTQISCKNLLAAIYISKQDPQTALMYLDEIIEDLQENQEIQGLPILYHTFARFGTAFRLQKKYDLALENWHRSLQHLLPEIRSEDPSYLPSSKELIEDPALINIFMGKSEVFENLYEQTGQNQYLIQALHAHKLSSKLEKKLMGRYEFDGLKYQLMATSHKRSEKAIELSIKLYRNTGNTMYLADIFYFFENARARVLLESLSQVEALRDEIVPDSVRIKEQILKTQYLYHERELQKGIQKGIGKRIQFQLEERALEAEQEHRSFIESIEQGYPFFKNHRNNQGIISLENFQERLKEEGALAISYFAGDSSMYALCITSNEVVPFDLGNIAVEESISQLRKSIFSKETPGEEDIATYIHSARTLYDRLLKPILDHVPDPGKRIMIIPDGLLAYIPFEVLLSHDPEDSYRFSAYPYLINDFEVFYSFAASLFRQTSAHSSKKNSVKTFLGIAPVFEECNDLSFLGHSENEVLAIQKILGGEVLLNSDATEKALIDLLKTHQYRVLHVSSHASLSKVPMDSYIQLYPEACQSNDENQFSLADLYAQRLSTEMVVLGACETGDGQLNKGEGIISLARGFANAGCQSLVATLWKINHFSTSQIMQYFYQELDQSKRKSAALRHAKMRFIKNNPGGENGAWPYYWAAYVPVGNMAPLHTHGAWSVMTIGFVVSLMLGIFLIIYFLRSARLHN